MNFKLKWLISKLLVYLQCYALWMRNIIFAKKFSLKHFSYINNLIVTSNRVELNWIVSGCHKIFINGFGIIPGNTSGIKIFYQPEKKKLELTFYGIGLKMTKEIILKATSIEFKHKFIPNNITPQLAMIPIAHQKLICVLPDSFKLSKSVNVNISFKKPKITQLNLNIHHEPFIKTNFLTKTF